MANLKFLSVAAAGVGLLGLAATPAAAQMGLGGLTNGAPYASVGGQFAAVEDADVEVAGVDVGEFDIDEDFGAIGAVGWHTATGWRGELEFSWFEADIGNLDTPIGLIAASGDLEVISGMANVLYELEFYPRVSPYIGGGIGVANIDVSGNILGTPGSDSDTVFAFQGIAGAAFEVTNNVSLIADYRYFATDDPELFGNVDAEIGVHKVMAGFRLSTN